MTAVLDPSTEQSTDLGSQRWEVETSVGVAITGELPPGGVDFVLVSHAEQFGGDFPVELTQPQSVFGNILQSARQELGLVTVKAGIGYNRGIPVWSYSDTGITEAISAPQALRGLLAGFVEDATGIRRLAQRAIVEDLIEQFPVPSFGSPPSDLTPLGQLISQTPTAILTGYGAWTESPILVIIGLGTALVIWIAKPSGNVLRRSLGERLAKKLNTEYHREDEQ